MTFYHWVGGEGLVGRLRWIALIMEFGIALETVTTVILCGRMTDIES
jgi:hypothetical protein